MGFINRLKQKALPYIFGATIGLFGGCGSDSNPTPSQPIVSGPVITDEQGEADISDTSDNTYHIVVRDEKTLELLADMDIYTVNHSVEIPVIDNFKNYISELRILPSEPQTLEVLLSKVTDRISDGLSENKIWFHTEPINWSEGTTKINKEPISMTQLADFYETYESDAIINLLEVLPDLWGINTFAQSAANFRDKVLENCSNISQILGLNPDEIFYDIYRENTTGMLYHVRIDGMGVSNSRPIVEIPYLRGTFSGDINIPHKLIDVEADLVDILVEFSKDGGLTFLPASQGIGGEGISNLNSSSTGINHMFVWNSKIDNIGLNSVKIKITPSDIGGEGYRDIESISVLNPKIISTFRSSYLSWNSEIYLIDSDGVKNLTNNPGSDDRAEDFDPSWSPDGTKIAFVSGRDNNYEIYTMNQDGSNLVRLINNTGKDINPKWSPDGNKIAFISERDGNKEIYVMNSNGSGQANLTNNISSDENIIWSPDGTKIAFVSGRDGNKEIYVMNSNGSGQIRLTNNSAEDFDPSWSPDGTKIAFVSERDSNREIYTMNPDGSNLVRLTNNTKSDYGSAWSPDGTKIAFVSERDSNREIYTMNPDGSSQTNLTNDYHDEWSPSWSLDNRVLAFIYESDYQKQNIYLIDIDDLSRVNLTNISLGNRIFSPPIWLPY